MSLSSATARNNYTGNGATSVYAYSFKIFDDDDLTVKVRDTDGAETTLVKTTDYTVSGVGETSGGNVTLVNASQSWLTSGSLKTSYELAIMRQVDLVQNTDIRNQGSYLPETHEETFDYLTMIDQRQQDELDRSLHLPDTIDPDDFDTVLPADIEDHAGKAIVVNSTGDGLTVSGSLTTAPLYYNQATRPVTNPSLGQLAFWKDTTLNQWKVWDQQDNDWRMFA